MSGMGRKELDLDTCIYCGATGCEDGTATHTDDCPSETGIFPVSMELAGPGSPCEKCGHISRELVPFKCSCCDHEFKLGEFFHHIESMEAEGGFPVYETVCAGCAAQAALLAD